MSGYAGYVSELQSVASSGIDAYATSVANQTNIQRLQAGLPPLPISWYDQNPFTATSSSPVAAGPSQVYPSTATGISPMFLLLIGLVVAYAMEKK
jgi:hypothetical protein